MLDGDKYIFMAITLNFYIVVNKNYLYNYSEKNIFKKYKKKKIFKLKYILNVCLFQFFKL